MLHLRRPRLRSELKILERNVPREDGIALSFREALKPFPWGVVPTCMCYISDVRYQGSSVVKSDVRCFGARVAVHSLWEQTHLSGAQGRRVHLKEYSTWTASPSLGGGDRKCVNVRERGLSFKKIMQYCPCPPAMKTFLNHIICLPPFLIRGAASYSGCVWGQGISSNLPQVLQY